MHSMQKGVSTGLAMEPQLAGMYDETEMGRKIWLYSAITVGLALAAFVVMLLPGLILQLRQPPAGAGHYVRMVRLAPDETLLEKFGPDFFPEGQFTNLRGDWEVYCSDQCRENEYFIGVQSHLLYHGAEAVASGKALRPAVAKDIIGARS